MSKKYCCICSNKKATCTNYVILKIGEHNGCLRDTFSGSNSGMWKRALPRKFMLIFFGHLHTHPACFNPQQ